MSELLTIRLRQASPIFAVSLSAIAVLIVLAVMRVILRQMAQ
jgi:hypothetical protein